MAWNCHSQPTMQLLPLLLATLFCLAVWAEQATKSSRRIDRIKERIKERFGQLSEEKKAKLRKHFGNIDPEKRKARLNRFNNRRRNNMTEEERQQLRDLLKAYVPIKTEKPSENEAVDLFEVNNKEGVSPYLFQGDMHLTEEQLHRMEVLADEQESEVHRVKRQASSYAKKWTSNTVNFYFDAAVSARKQASVAAAHKYISSRTCINFVQSSTAANRIKVINGAGCYSNVGMVGGEQTLSLGDGCEVVGTSAHEFTHALGVWHTQMRSDRDSYVTIDMTYVPQNYQGNFEKLNPADNILLVPYEYGSFMHYSSNSFTNPSSQLSIVPKDMNYAYTMGNRQISFYDILMINKHYGCDAACTAANSAQCKNGGVPNPRNCAVCNCPLGYEGPLCDQRPTGCGETLTATTVWQTKQFSFGDMTDNQNVRDVFTLCNHWIQAPSGYQTQVQITNMWNSQCQFGCPFNGIEIKGNDQKMTNPRFCCAEFQNKIINSTLNPTPIISFNRYYYTTFTIQYRAVPSSGVITTIAPPTTVKPTTAKPSVNNNCHSMNTKDACLQNVRAGFCTMTNTYSQQVIKYNCAEECNLCGKAANPCVDTNTPNTCAAILAQGMCSTLDPMVAEYNCAKTCGYCLSPN